MGEISTVGMFSSGGWIARQTPHYSGMSSKGASSQYVLGGLNSQKALTIAAMTVGAAAFPLVRTARIPYAQLDWALWKGIHTLTTPGVYKIWGAYQIHQDWGEIPAVLGGADWGIRLEREIVPITFRGGALWGGGVRRRVFPLLFYGPDLYLKSEPSKEKSQPLVRVKSSNRPRTRMKKQASTSMRGDSKARRKSKPKKMSAKQKKRLWRMGLRWCNKHRRYDKCSLRAR